MNRLILLLLFTLAGWGGVYAQSEDTAQAAASTNTSSAATDAQAAQAAAPAQATSGSQAAANTAAELEAQAREFLAKKEYIKARYHFKRAYEQFARQGNYAQAVACGVQTVALYHRENLYQEGFDLLREVEAVLGSGEKKAGKQMPAQRFSIARERFQMYVKMVRTTQAKEQLARLEEYAKAADNDSIENELLYLEANFYYAYGPVARGDEAINRLVDKYNSRKEYDRVDECFKTLIGIARRGGNTQLVARTYDRYIAWGDSIHDIAAQEKLAVVQGQYDEALATIVERDQSLSTRWIIILGLCVLSGILAVVLVIGAIVLLRYIFLTRRQKKAIAVARELGELKSRFIHNISTQMEPTLATLPQELAGVQALRAFSAHIQELSDLENTLSELYPLEERNVVAFCDSVADQVKGELAEDVTLTVGAPRLSVRLCSEPLEHVLLHLLRGAAEHTPAGGKIWLDFKKRGAHTQQFIVSDTGPGIPEELRADLFRPFTEVRDLTQGDGLGLPICALIATKMNGSLSLDTSYTRGARFVLELHV